MKDKLIIILGPTACGKTELSLKVAKEFKGEVISADSMQVYRGMDIGTAKLPVNRRENIPHHLIDILEPDQDYSVAVFQKAALDLIKKINERMHIPIIVGGTGLYISSLTGSYIFPEIQETDKKEHKLKRKELSAMDQAALYQKLSEIDETAAKRIHPHDIKRVIRALEVYYQSGKTVSQWHQNNRPPLISRYQTALIGLNTDREALYQAINQRVDRMIEEGLINEVENLLKRSFSPQLNSMQGLGYKQIALYLEHQISKEEAVLTIKRDTRRFAKRQLTWFKRDQHIAWFNKTDYPGTAHLEKAVINYIRQVFEEEDYD